MFRHLHTYCKKWKLNVNINKTKIMIFDISGKFMNSNKLLYNNESRDAVQECKYVGLFIKASVKFTTGISEHSIKVLIV